MLKRQREEPNNRLSNVNYWIHHYFGDYTFNPQCVTKLTIKLNIKKINHHLREAQNNQVCFNKQHY